MGIPTESNNIYHLEKAEHEIKHVNAEDYDNRDEAIHAFCRRLKYQSTRNFYDFIKSNENEETGGLRFCVDKSKSFKYSVVVNMLSNRDMKITIHMEDSIRGNEIEYGGLTKLVTDDTIDRQILTIKEMIKDTLSVKQFLKNKKEASGDAMNSEASFKFKFKRLCNMVITQIGSMRVFL